MRAPTRHVLLTLSLHMSPDGSNCFPSVATVSARTGLAERTIITHLDHAEREGWIVRGSRGAGGQGWRRHKYRPLIPDMVKEMHHVDPEGGEGDAPRSGEGGEPHDRNVVNEVHTNQSVNQSESIWPKGPPKRDGTYIYPEAFEAMWEAYPDRSGSNPKPPAYKAWRARVVTDGVDPADLLAGAQAYGKYALQNGQVGTPYVMQARKFFGPDELWHPDNWKAGEANGFDTVRAVAEHQALIAAQEGAA